MNENIPVPPAEGADVPAEDEALVRRVRSADPAALLEPDAPALRAAVDQRIGAGRTDELAAVRARRWTSWPVRVAGVAAGALLVGGGGGYAVGAAGAAPSPASPAITLQGQGAPEGQSDLAVRDEAAGTTPLASMTPEEAPSSMRSDMSYWPGYWGGHTVFTSSGLSGEGGSASAWAFDPAQVFTQEVVARVAAGLGVAGTPVLADGYWQVGPNDGTGPAVTLYPDGTASVSYYDPTKDPWSCVPQTDPATSEGKTAEGSTESSGGSVEGAEGDGSQSMIAPDPCAQRDLGPAPQGDPAIGAARDALAAIGVDPAGYELVAEGWGDEAWSYVSAYQVVDGQRSGIQWSLSFTGAGLQSLSGSLAPVVELGEYDVISPEDAVARLTDPRFGSGLGGPIMYAEDSAAAMEGEVAPDIAVAPSQPTLPTLPPTITAGSPLRWPVLEVTITAARLGLAMQTQPDGAAALLPTYELTSSDGAVWSVVAVADSELDFSPTS